MKKYSNTVIVIIFLIIFSICVVTTLDKISICIGSLPYIEESDTEELKSVEDELQLTKDELESCYQELRDCEM